jgi:hypothetical protein
MKNKISYSYFLFLFLLIAFLCCQRQNKTAGLSLTLIPPTTITNQVNLDVRAGIRNTEKESKALEVTFYLDEETEKNILYSEKITLAANAVACVKFLMPTKDRVGKHIIKVAVKKEGAEEKAEKEITILSSTIRSTKEIGGAWMSFYHWSETEGKMWNPIIRELTDDQWKEMVSSMHELGMDIIVIQESFRNQAYVGQHAIEDSGYKGKAFYPSTLYPSRMPVKAKDPLAAVLTQADKLGMHVFMGVGMYAWFDYTKGSLQWHKKVAKELWDMYGTHASFYGFYVSEEGMGSLDCFEKDSSKHDMRRKEVLDFFKEFTPFCKQMAPDKPVMFAPNGWGVGRAKGAYAELLKNVDIISPFAFARMPEGDLDGKQAINLLQQYCDTAKAHLWLDLEAFLFNEKEGYLYPRPITEIKQDLELFNSFEKVICYQYPGVFNNPKMSVRVGEASTTKLFLDYQNYLKGLSKK